ncbi:hypothetical protein ACAG25_23310 [Mycobacterium sp. pV006]|uniref:hypothetical protein n=1 Tax=Mycobacterium sp. pV006 TaxID=3238983 RepID=UPI00351BB329
MRELRDLFHLVSVNWLMVATCCLIGGVLAGAANLMAPVTYKAIATVFIATPNWNDSTAMPSATGPRPTSYGDEYSQMRIPTYQRLVETPVVLAPVVERLGLEMTPAQLGEHISTRPVPDTVMINIEAGYESAGGAATIANAVAEQLITVIKEVEKPTFNSASPVQPIIVRPAVAPSGPTSPRVLVNVGAGLAVGLVIGMTLAAFRTRRRDVLPPATGENLLGVITMNEINDDGEVRDISGDTRFLRIALLAALDEKPAGAVLLTAPRSSELAFTAALQLSRALAESGASTVLVAADYTMHPFGIDGPGLGELLSEEVAIDDALIPLGPHRHALVGPGKPPKNVTAAFTSHAITEVVTQLGRRFDYVLLQGPAVLESTDAIDLANRAGSCALLCPPATAAEDIDEGEYLLGLADADYLGKILILNPEAVSTLESQR